MPVVLKGRKTKLNRWFGRCRIAGCKYRLVLDSDFIDGELVYYTGANREALIARKCWCPVHDTWMKWDQLQGRYSKDKECNAICMAAVGPSCDCQCGGENHGKNHVFI